VKVLAIVNSWGVVHNWSNGNCRVVQRVHEIEFRGGREQHKVVRPIQVLVYRLPPCHHCWGPNVNFRQMVEAM
jgi:hypothetical protein